MFFSRADATVLDTSVMGSVFLVLSHCLLPYASWLFWSLRMWYALTIVVSLNVFSMQYHICKADWYCFGMGDTSTPVVTLVNGTNVTSVVYPGLERTRLLDHIASNYAWVAIVVMALMGDSRGSNSKSIIGQLLMLFTVVYAETAFPFQNRALIIIMSVLMHLIVLMVFVTMKLKLPDGARFHRGFIAGGVVTGTVGFACYTIDMGPYDVTHTIWHICITAAFILLAVGLNYDKARALHRQSRYSQGGATQ